MFEMLEIPVVIIYAILFIDFFIVFFNVAIFIIKKFKKQIEKKIKYFNITFVIPAYNAEKLLEKTVEALKKADYPQDKIKIIIVNDGSIDGTLKIAKKIAQRYQNIKVFDKKNTGKADTLNFGIKKADTELVAVLDADTIIKPDLLEKAVYHFSDEKSVAVTSRFKPINNKKLIERLQYVEYTLSGFYRTLIGHINSLPFAPAFTIFRREFFLKYGYFEKGNLTEDFEIGLRIQSKHYNIGYIGYSCAATDVPDNFKKLFRQRLRWGYGYLYNCKKYKYIFFNRKYGDLGFFILPSGLVSILMMSAVFLMGAYNLLAWVIKHIQMLLIGWAPSFTFNFDRFLLLITDLRIILFLFAIILGTSIFLLTRSEFKEKIKLKDYALMITVYLWMLAFFYIVSLIYFIIGKKPSW